jgi:hypothetical protein
MFNHGEENSRRRDRRGRSRPRRRSRSRSPVKRRTRSRSPYSRRKLEAEREVNREVKQEVKHEVKQEVKRKVKQEVKREVKPAASDDLRDVTHKKEMQIKFFASKLFGKELREQPETEEDEEEPCAAPPAAARRRRSPRRLIFPDPAAHVGANQAFCCGGCGTRHKCTGYRCQDRSRASSAIPCAWETRERLCESCFDASSSEESEDF